MANKYAKESVKEAVGNKITKLGPTRTCLWHRRKEKQDKARKLAEERANRTDKEQLEHLDSINGQGKGAVKERARLNLRIAAARAPKKK
jgi:hypothetical protein